MYCIVCIVFALPLWRANFIITVTATFFTTKPTAGSLLNRLFSDVTSHVEIAHVTLYTVYECLQGKVRLSEISTGQVNVTHVFNMTYSFNHNCQTAGVHEIMSEHVNGLPL